MVAYHFAFDLAYFRVTAQNFYRDPFWLHSRTAILSSFLLIAGISLVLAQSTPQGRARFWIHVGRVAACAVAVTAGSYLVFPRSFIWFGVLHAIALSLVMIRPLVARPWLALGIGIAVVIAGNVVASPAFDSRALGWIGFMTAKPITEDYVPRLSVDRRHADRHRRRARRCYVTGSRRSRRSRGFRRCCNGSDGTASPSTWSTSRFSRCAVDCRRRGRTL